MWSVYSVNPKNSFYRLIVLNKDYISYIFFNPKIASTRKWTLYHM